MNEQEFIRQLKKLQGIKPRTEWKERDRSLLLHTIREEAPFPESENVLKHRFPAVRMLTTVGRWISLFFPNSRTLTLLRPTGVFFMASLILLSSSIITVSAAQNSIPGDTLYTVKIVTEKVQKALTTSEPAKAKLELEFASKRIDELEKIVQEPTTASEKTGKIVQVIDGFQKNISSANASLETVSVTASPTDAVDLATAIDEKSKEYKEKLDKVAENVSLDTKNVVTQAADSAEANGDSALTVIVDKHASGEVSVDPEIIGKKVEEKITGVDSSIADLTAEIDLLFSGTSTAPLLADSESDDPATSTAKLLIAQDQLAVAEKVLAEAHDLVSKNELPEALAKVTESKSFIGNVKKRVQEVEIALGVAETEATPVVSDAPEQAVSQTSTSTPDQQSTSTPPVAENDTSEANSEAISIEQSTSTTETSDTTVQIQTEEPSE